MTALHAATLQVADGRERWIGCAILLLTFGVFGGWAAFAPLDSASLAPGVITVEHARKTVQHLEGGIVSALHVRDGDRVKAGDVLITLSDSRTAAEREMLRSQLAALQAMQVRLAAERDGLPALPGVDGADELAREAHAMETRVFQARRAAREGEAGVLHKRVLQLQAQISGFATLIAGKRALAASYTEEITDLRELLREGFVDRQRLREQERSLARLRGEIAQLQASSAQSRLEAAKPSCGCCNWTRSSPGRWRINSLSWPRALSTCASAWLHWTSGPNAGRCARPTRAPCWACVYIRSAG
ncbi:biotin/lipoyl-binding protein [Pseudomonas brassicae]|uniref:biotin/lipoyl-binding protein n=1 Tax=Pseudomonas brassicae TaxID=2708063 RepID=UPI003083E33D